MTERAEPAKPAQRSVSVNWVGRITKGLAVIWTAPNTVLGMFFGWLGLLSGGQVRFRDGCLEFWGGSVSWMLQRLPIRAVAMTLGHTVLGINSDYLYRAGKHERVHVRQYERWGPFFLFGYFGWSAWIWWKGGNAYLDNPFEVEAYREAP